MTFVDLLETLVDVITLFLYKHISWLKNNILFTAKDTVHQEPLPSPTHTHLPVLGDHVSIRSIHSTCVVQLISISLRYAS